MANPLKEIIVQSIRENGPMRLDEFMALALAHPVHGYYKKADPLGAAGDFTTAPEISQMFGEMIGAWVADCWMRMGLPQRFILLECGPGRGTLMADIMRAIKGVHGIDAACDIHLLETSPVLREKQAQALDRFEVAFHDGLESIPDGAPIILVGNEFLDALPFRQFEKTPEGWEENCLVLGPDDALVITPQCISHNTNKKARGGVSSGMQERLLEFGLKAKTGDIFEVSPEREAFVVALARRLKVQGGAALLIDYGHETSGFGDTFQAVYKHKYCGVLEHVGDADLTSHVDFEALALAARDEGVQAVKIMEQGVFLKSLGIDLRAQALAVKANDDQRRGLSSALHRLTHPDEMGRLFKVMMMECLLP